MIAKFPKCSCSIAVFIKHLHRNACFGKVVTIIVDNNDIQQSWLLLYIGLGCNTRACANETAFSLLAVPEVP